MSEPDEWENPEMPPVEAVALGSDVWVSWKSPFNQGDEPLLWHWCDRSIDGGPPMWRAAGVRAHTLASREPLHLEPSVYWPDCCGKHGFVREGRWEAA